MGRRPNALRAMENSPPRTSSDSNFPLLGHNGSIVVAVEEAKRAFSGRNPNSKALYARAQSVMPGGNTRSALHFDPFPLYVEESFGARIRDADGHIYIDALGEYTAGLYGHNDAMIRQAVHDALAKGVSNGAPGVGEIRLAEAICERFPNIEQVRFCNSGTEANLYALSLARAATKRGKLLCFSGAYHGGVFVFAGGGNAMNAPFEWTICRYNDVEAAGAAIDRLGDTLAAVIVEPMMSNGGCIPATADFLKALRKRTSDNGALLIFDEVVTSRMSQGGLQGVHGINPDLTTLGKYLGAGFSFGAFGGRASLMDLMNPTHPDALPHAGTFNNNVISMAAGAAGLESIYTRERANALFESGEKLRARLNEVAAHLAPSIQFTGCGSVLNIHFHTGSITCPDDLADEPKSMFDLLHFDLMERGVYAARRGQINLSLPMNEADLESIVDAVRIFLTRREPLLSTLGNGA
jgi:glutamate-1-semialdehyde 2,1-aminomutase